MDEKKKPEAPQLSPARARAMAPRPAAGSPAQLDQLSTRELFSSVAQDASKLIKSQIELARAEITADLKAEVAMAKGLTVAGICLLCTLNLALVAIALSLGAVLPEWAGALVVAAAVLAVGTVAGLVGWGKRVKNPLAATRRSLKEDVQWAKERIA